jgi:hypothetical protein
MSGLEGLRALPESLKVRVRWITAIPGAVWSGRFDGAEALWTDPKYPSAVGSNRESLRCPQDGHAIAFTHGCVLVVDDAGRILTFKPEELRVLPALPTKAPFGGRVAGDRCACGGWLREQTGTKGRALLCSNCVAGYDEEGRHWCPGCCAYVDGWIGGTDTDPQPSCRFCSTPQPGWR